MTYDEYVRYLMQGQIQPWTKSDPFAPSVDQYNPYQNMMPSWDYGSLGDQAKALNITQDFADIGSDPAILGGLMGEMPAETQYTYKPNQGFQMLTNASKMEGTLEQAIADEILNGGSAASAISRIKALNPDRMTQLGVPTYVDDAGDEVPDMNYVKDIATQFQSEYLKDPTATGIDPQTGMPGVGEAQKNPMAEWYQKTNTPLPNQQYTGDDLATQDQLATLYGNGTEGSDVTSRVDKARKAMMDLYLGAEPLDYSPPGGGVLAPKPSGGGGGSGMQAAFEQTPQRGGWADDLDRATQDPGGAVGNVLGGIGGFFSDIPGKLDRNIGDPVEGFFNGKEVGLGQIAGDEEGAHIPYPTIRNAAGAEGGTETSGSLGDIVRSRQAQAGRLRQPSSRSGRSLMARAIPQISEQQRKYMGGQLAADQSWAEAMNQERMAYRDAQERDKLAGLMAQQGHTPYRDTMAQRRQMMQYMGFGV